MTHDIVVDLGYGDAGKGTVVDWLCSPANGKGPAHAVVRFNGGAQAAHNVVTPDGRHHTFAQFGSGTFHAGVRTHLSCHVLVDPLALIAEADHLVAQGVPGVLDRLTVDRRALLTTPYHRAANRARLSDEFGELEAPAVAACAEAFRAFAASVRLVDDAYLRRCVAARDGCCRIELRVDSSFRGSAADEFRGVLEAWGRDEVFAVAVPAFPRARRTTVGGRQMTSSSGPEGIPVADVLFPGEAARCLSLHEVRGGGEALCRVMESAAEEGIRRFVVDATEEADLRIAAQATAQLEQDGWPVVTMSPGAWLAYHPVRRTRPVPYVLVVVGSPTPENSAQLAELAADRRLIAIVRAEDGAAGGIDWDRARTGGIIAVETITASDAAGKHVHAELAATVARRVLADGLSHGQSCRAVIATGGHTAASLVEVLGASAIEPVGEIESLAARGVISGGDWDGLDIATKGGNVGASKTLQTMVNEFLEFAK